MNNPLLKGAGEKESILPATKAAEDEEHTQALELRQRLRAQRKRRFFHVFAILAVISVWTATSRWAQSKSIISLLKCGGGKHPHHPHELPIPPGVALEECTKWDGGDDSVNASSTTGPGYDGSDSQVITSWAEFSLPTDKPLLFIARGRFPRANSFKIVQSDNRVSTDAKVKVAVTYNHEHVLDFLKVCKVARLNEDGEKSTGIGIFIPQWAGRHPHGPHRRNSPIFDVVLELPQAKKKSDKEDKPLRISRLETDLPLFVHSISRLATVNFGKLILKSYNTRIDVSDVWADDIVVSTVNAAILGTYRAWKSITLKTANAPIKVNLELQNLKSSVATYATLISVNAPIVANTTLETTEANPGGNFTLTAYTKNSPLALNVTSAPVNSTLNVRGGTVLGAVEATLPAPYEGTVALSTILSSAKVIAEENREDPDGRNRTRSVAIDRVSPGKVNGAIWWDVERKSAGSVTLESTLAPVTLFT